MFRLYYDSGGGGSTDVALEGVPFWYRRQGSVPVDNGYTP